MNPLSLDFNQDLPGQSLPNWSIEPIFGENIPTLEDYAGKPLLILLFSLGCPGCLGRAIPYANRVLVEHGQALPVIGIHTNIEAVDFSTDRFSKAKEDLYIRFPFFKDKNYNNTFWIYGAGGTPHWILVDKKGDILYSIFGSDPNNALLRLDYKIHELLTGGRTSEDLTA